jgi:hypothetical protein
MLIALLRIAAYCAILFLSLSRSDDRCRPASVRQLGNSERPVPDCTCLGGHTRLASCASREGQDRGAAATHAILHGVVLVGCSHGVHCTDGHNHRAGSTHQSYPASTLNVFIVYSSRTTVPSQRIFDITLSRLRLCCVQHDTPLVVQLGSLVPSLPNASYSCIIQVVQPVSSPPVESQPAAPMATMYSRGWITCECGPVDVKSREEKQAADADKPIRNSLTAKSWQLLLTDPDRERKCPWKIVYRYCKSTRTFHVTERRELSHAGHAFYLPALNGTVLHAAKDLTPVMHAKLQAWLRMRIPGPNIRQVHISHVHASYLGRAPDEQRHNIYIP